MIKSFVINMDKDKDRLSKFQIDWKHVKITTPERVRGLVGSELRNSPQVTEFCKEYCTNGMIGCYASHIYVMNKIVQEQLPFAIVLEDDAMPCEQFDLKLQQLFQHIPPNFDIVLLGHTGNIKKTIGFEALNTLLDINKHYQHINDYLCIPYNAIGAHGYLISLSGAKKIIERYGQINFHIDAYLFSKNDLSIYSTYEQLILTRTAKASLGESYSFTVDGTMFDNDVPVTWVLHTSLFKYKDTNVLLWHFILGLMLVLLLFYYSIITLNIPLLLGIIIMLIYFNFFYKRFYK